MSPAGALENKVNLMRREKLPDILILFLISLNLSFVLAGYFHVIGTFGEDLYASSLSAGCFQKSSKLLKNGEIG